MKVNAINILNHVFTAKRVSHNENRQNNICMPQTSYDCFQKNNIYNAITFTGVDGRGKVKQRGMMFHISNLPATRSYCGQFLDPETDKFIDFLEKSRQTHWIMNPLFALGEDLRPYNASGRFSKNIYLVNLNELTKDKYGNILKPS